MKRYHIYVGDKHVGGVNAQTSKSAKRKAILKTGLSYKLKAKRSR